MREAASDRGFFYGRLRLTFYGSALRRRVWLCRGVLCRVGEPAGMTLAATPAATPQGKAATAAVYQWPTAGSGFAWGFSSRLSLPPRKRPVIPDRPRLRGLVQSKPSPAATGPEGHPRRLFRALRWGGGRAGFGFTALSAIASTLAPTKATAAWMAAARCTPHAAHARTHALAAPGRSEPCSRTLSLAKANEAIHLRQASVPNQRSAPPLDPTLPQSPQRAGGCHPRVR